MRSSTWAFVIDVAFHVLKLFMEKKNRRRSEMRSEHILCIQCQSVWVPYLLLVTLLTSLNMSFHASFVLHGHCLPATVHDCLVVESVMNEIDLRWYCDIVFVGYIINFNGMD